MPQLQGAAGSTCQWSPASDSPGSLGLGKSLQLECAKRAARARLGHACKIAKSRENIDSSARSCVETPLLGSH